MLSPSLRATWLLTSLALVACGGEDGGTSPNTGGTGTTAEPTTGSSAGSSGTTAATEPAGTANAGQSGTTTGQPSTTSQPSTTGEDAALPAPDAGAIDAGSSNGSAMLGPAPTRWRMGAPMRTPRSELAVALLDGRAYVAGGYGSSYRPTAAFEAYDIEGDSWQALADMPEAMEHPCLAALDGQIYLSCGQRDASSGPSPLYVYDPAMDAWDERASMPTPRWGATALAFEGALYVVGGNEPAGWTIQRYDPADDSWTAHADLDLLRDHSVSVVHGNKVYVLGGRPGLGDVYDTSVIYDPATDGIDPGPMLDVGRSGFAAASVGSYLCAAGGEVLVDPFRALDTGGCMDPETGAWTAAEPLPKPLHGIGAVGYQGRMYVFGGASEPARASPLAGTVWILEP